MNMPETKAPGAKAEGAQTQSAAEKAAELQNEKTQANIGAEKADTAMRKHYADRILRFLEIYGTVVGAFIAFSGFGLWGFKMPSETMMTLVGSTAVAAIGLVGFIVKGLFSSSG